MCDRTRPRWLVHTGPSGVRAVPRSRMEGGLRREMVGGLRRRLGVAGLAALLAAGLTGVAGCGGETATAPRWQAGPASGASGKAAPSSTASAGHGDSAGGHPISMSATGDIIMGNAPERLPANGGEAFFDGVRSALDADLVMGNLEEPLTDETGYSKCAPSVSPSLSPSVSPSAGAGTGTKPTAPSGCHQFRAPPGYAAHLREAGFMVLNQANNHAHDYGTAGFRNTQKALDKHQIRYTGKAGEIAVVEVRGLRIAVVGFSPYAWSNSVVNIGAAKKLVTRAAGQADLVVVQAHMGAEGSTKTRVKPGTEMFLGENRGDPVKFSHAVIDAGADLVVGHGPHVMRAMEFYRGRLIAYSLGNFAGGGGTLSRNGPLGLGAVLRVSLHPDGSYASGQLVSTYMNSAGKPTTDSRERGLELVTDLCGKDFPSTGAGLDAKGNITPPTA